MPGVSQREIDQLIDTTKVAIGLRSVYTDERWDAHLREHAHEQEGVKVALGAVREQSAAHAAAHDREHAAHETRHADAREAVNKAEAAVDRRLEQMNEFRAQLEKQAATFLTRETFDAYQKEQSIKLDKGVGGSGEKYDALINAVVARHDGDMDSIREQLQTERESRKTFEGSINTWRWIASFLGASGVAGVVLLFATRPG